MGNGNGRGDVLYALVDDVTDLKALMARSDERWVLMKAQLDRMEQRLDRTESNTVSLRRQLSAVVSVVQVIADKLVAMEEKWHNHEQRIAWIEKDHGQQLAQIRQEHGQWLARIEARLSEHGQRLFQVEGFLTKKGWKH
jgi:septal ring factor EnvC (AmiA/AmiB activator)